MTIYSKSKRSSKIEVDLSGPQGNAFYLLGLANSLSRSLDLDYRKVSGEMKSGDYENLLKVFDTYFGDFVDLYR